MALWRHVAQLASLSREDGHVTQLAGLSKEHVHGCWLRLSTIMVLAEPDECLVAHGSIGRIKALSPMTWETFPSGGGEGPIWCK